MGEETFTKTSGGLPNLSLMKTPVYHLHSLVRLLRLSLHPPTAILTQTRANIDQPAWMPDVPLPTLPFRGGDHYRRATSGHQEVQGFFNCQPNQQDALPHIQELPIPHASITPPVHHLLVHFISDITVEGWTPTPSRQASC